MTDTARGFRTRAALTREAIVTTPTWPAASAAAATALLPLLSESVRERPVRESVTTVDGVQAPDTLARPVSGECALMATYNGLELLFALALGYQAKRYAGSVYPLQLATGVYQSRFEVDSDLRSLAWDQTADGFSGGELSAGQQRIRRATLCVDKQVATWESKSCMLNALELEATPAGVSLGLGLVAHSLTRASVVNPSLSALATPTAFSPVRFSELVCRIGAYSVSTALDSSNVLAVSGVRLSLDNRLAAQQSVTTAPYSDEPARIQPAQVAGSLFLPRYQADTLLAFADAGTELMADMVFSGPTIPGTASNYSLAFYLPAVSLLETDIPTTGPAWHQVSMPFVAYPKTPGAGFPVGLKNGALMVEIVSELSTNPLL
jgi:hypothetical protein